MAGTPAQTGWTGILPRLPVAVRLMLTVFLAIVGAGYLTALANVYHRHHLADGKEGLSPGDISAVYSGMTLVRGEEIPSRMLTMIRTEMRQYIQSQSDFDILENWLTAGGTEAGLDAGKGRATPRRAIIRNCLECHAQSAKTEISKRTPFGPDDFEVDYAMLSAVVSAPVEGPGETLRIPPQYDVSRLVLVSHIHMLVIPVFAVIVGLLFSLTRLPRRVRAVLTPLPMCALLLDFAGWWLARLADVFAHVIAAAGAVFGLAFAIQLIAVAIDMWRPGTATDSEPRRSEPRRSEPRP